MVAGVTGILSELTRKRFHGSTLDFIFGITSVDISKFGYERIVARDLKSGFPSTRQTVFPC